MILKRTAAALLAAFAAAAMTATAYADNDTYNTYDNAAPAQTEAPSYNNQAADNQWQDTAAATTTTQPVYTAPAPTTTTTLVADKPTSKPGTVALDVGEVKNGEFKVKLKINCDALISNASASVSYDSALLEYVSSEQNDDAGGMAVENCFDGKFVYNYVNKDGTDYQGTYITLKFKIIDETMVSTVLYLSVTSLDDNNLVPISYSAENAIVRNPDAAVEEPEPEESELEEIVIPFTNEPVMLSEYGIEDVKECVIENGEVMLYEDGSVLTMETGTTKITVTHSDGSKSYYLVKVTDETESSDGKAVEAAASINDKTDKQSKTADKAKDGNRIRNLLIIGVVTIAVIVLIAEYIMIMKPFGKKAKKTADDDEAAEDGQTSADEETMAELEKAIKEKNAKSPAAKIDDSSRTEQINKELVKKGFILTEQSDDDEYDE
ncbi:MAG: hypothetical protein Q4E74_04040 [Ruminococcus sp.]|nr:hypothetical protein [Ruminococcus sp.]